MEPEGQTGPRGHSSSRQTEPPLDRALDFEKEGAGKRNKLTLVSWAPDTAKIKQKMLFASSMEALPKALVGVAVEIQGTEYSEVASESVLDKAKRGNWR